ncbi:glycoside hydrolase superfamily [Gorgonomyces haynaldii]|nr:glycoside hydrolase superfamily [Gorgonomyces haynaldii]
MLLLSFSVMAQMSFLVRQGNRLYENGKEFRFVSYNVPNLLLLEGRTSDYSWVPPTPQEQRDAIESVKGSYGRVIRTYTLGFGSGYHVEGISKYNEQAFVAMDNAIAIAAENNIRLLVPLVNNHYGGDGGNLGFGDYGFICQFRGKKPSQFYTDSQLKSDFKSIISYILNRKNTVSGVRYGDDPVLMWQLGNELGTWQDPVPPAQWTIEMAQYIKSLAPKQLVADGTLGGLDAPNRFEKLALQDGSVDIFSCHYYWGSSDLDRIDRDANFVASYNKVFIVGEFGLTQSNVIQSLLYRGFKNKNVAGMLIWSLRYHSRDGGFYVHTESDGTLSYHVPGFPQAEGFSADESTLVESIRYNAIRIQGLLTLGMINNVPYPTPPAPKQATGTITPKALRWFGSSWAAQYKISRKSGNSYNLIATVKDNVVSGQTIYSDPNASKGQTYEYKIEAIGKKGQVSAPFYTGPIKF